MSACFAVCCALHCLLCHVCDVVHLLSLHAVRQREGHWLLCCIDSTTVSLHSTSIVLVLSCRYCDILTFSQVERIAHAACTILVYQTISGAPVLCQFASTIALT
eukprot:769365-Rhodomonas_salina.1